MILNRPIGIDLGTTNSAVALLMPNERDLFICPDSQGRLTVPSCVWLDPKTKSPVIGHRAYARRGSYPPPITSIKRSMGTQMTVPYGDEQKSPAAISALILSELKESIQSQLAARDPDRRFEIEKAIITVPAYFGLPAIEATREAGRIAGLEVIELLHEPTAAAIYYGWKHDLGDGVYLVYDFGGGTFDASVLQRTGGEFLVLGISGNNFLGGDEFDRRLARHLLQLLIDDGYDLELDLENDESDHTRFNALVALAEKAKKELTDNDEVLIRDQGSLTDKSGQPVIIELPIQRSTLDELIDDLIERTIACCRDALSKAHEKSGISLSQISHILLVGGSTYVPAVVQRVQDAFCNPNKPAEERAMCESPIRDSPETAVALGAALRAATTGIGITDEQTGIRVWFTGVAATRREQTTIHGTVESRGSDADLCNGCLRLTRPNGEAIMETEIRKNGRFTLPKVDLQIDSVNDFRIEIRDSSGTTVATFHHSVVHDRRQHSAVGGALSTAVLSKPISLEGTDGDRRVQQVLLPAGTSLPARARFTFAIADSSGEVRLPVSQESRVIKEIHASLGKIEVGTPVDIEIRCDELVNIEVQCSIGNQSFGGSIEPPPPDSVPTEYDIAELDRRFARIARRLLPDDARELTAEYTDTRADLDEARSSADFPKIVQRAADLEQVICRAQEAEPLEPPLEVVNNNYSQCQELLPVVSETHLDIVEMITPQLDKANADALAAFQLRDRQKYADSVRVIDTGLKFLIGMTRTAKTEITDVDHTVQASMALDETLQMGNFLLMFYIANRLIEECNALMRQLNELRELEHQVGTEPAAVVNRCQVAMTEMRRKYQQLNPGAAKSPELEGLIDVGSRSAKYAPSVDSSGFNDR